MSNNLRLFFEKLAEAATTVKFYREDTRIRANHNGLSCRCPISVVYTNETGAEGFNSRYISQGGLLGLTVSESFTVATSADGTFAAYGFDDEIRLEIEKACGLV